MHCALRALSLYESLFQDSLEKLYHDRSFTLSSIRPNRASAITGK